MYGMKKNGMKNGMKKKGVAKKHKGFSKLPEAVQRKMNKNWCNQSPPFIIHKISSFKTIKIYIASLIGI